MIARVHAHDARLLYFTTSGSHEHLQALTCWNAPWLREFDVHLYSNRMLSSSWHDVLNRIPSKNHMITIHQNEHSHQQGAILAFLSARSLFAKYTWVIRTNPDVHVVNAHPFLTWMSDPQINAILANCEPTVYCSLNCAHALVHTDFTIFRPKFISWNASALNAEMHMSELMHQVLLTNNVRWLQSKGFRDRSCRIRAGVRENNTMVIHDRFHRGCLSSS